jgi:hypothetical protein
LAVEEVGKYEGVERKFRPVAARLDDARQLPTQSCSYEGVDAVVFSTSRPEIYRGLSADDSRIEAIDQWVRMGGRLVLCVGSRAEEILAAASPLGRFVPGRLEKMESLHQTGALEAYCNSRSPALPTGGGRIATRVPQLLEVKGVVEAREADLPIIVRTARGFGQVIFVAADLDRPPLAKWTDLPLLTAKLLDMSEAATEESGENAAMMHYGYSDISGQLRSALDRYDGVRLAPFWLVAALIAAYILLIGPGDYFLLRRIGRMYWTWLTFPLVVVFAGLVACGLAYWFKGDRLRVSQVDLVDVDAESGRLRGTAWMDVFSPRTELFDLTVRLQQPDGRTAADARAWMAWLGLPGTALGGMNPRVGDLSSWDEEFRYAPGLSALVGVPIPVWSSKSFTARWDAPAAAGPSADLAEADQLLVGRITNTLPLPLDECILAYGGSVYELGTLEPGRSARLGPMTKRSDLKTLLTGRRAVRDQGENYRQQATPYDQSSTDIPYIMRMMMFYKAAGGRSYTGLWNDYQGFVDLSDLLQADRAILVAHGPSSDDEGHHGAELLRDGKRLGGTGDRHVTMYRFVFPVMRGERRGERGEGKAEQAATSPQSFSVVPLISPLSSLP